MVLTAVSMIRRHRAALIAINAATAFVPAAAWAQQAERNSSVLALPRPGYEPRTLSKGPTEVRLESDVLLTYDSNVFANHSDPQDDAVLEPSARLTASRRGSAVSVDGEAYVARKQHFRLGHESSTTFGASLRGQANVARDQTLTGHASYDRAIESRADPEAPPGEQQPPRKIDIAVAEGEYGITGSRISVSLGGAFRLYNYLAADETDRDMETYEGNLRLSYLLSGPTAIFVEPYVVRRRFRRHRDFNGIDRNAITTGALAGISREVSAKISGRIGIGFFRFTPDTDGLPPATGFAAQGSLTWTPRQRQSWTLSVLSGDVATVRAGATGRHDTSLSLRLDQEVRHNLLFDADLSWQQNKYRGAPTSDRDTYRAGANLTLLLSRSLGLVVGATYTHRTAADPRNAFNRETVSIGLRFQH